MNPLVACPEASVLAAYAEGRLDREARALVERHMADCPECPVVVGAAVDFLRADEPEPHVEVVTGGPWWRIAAAVALVALAIPAILWTVVGRDGLARLRTVAATLPERPVEGRLESFPHAPCAPPRSVSEPTPELAFRAEIERLRARDTTDVETMHALGVAMLLGGEVMSARTLLERAARRAPREAALWNDLSVAYLAPGARGKTADAEALVAAAHAIAIDDSRAAAHFNRAVALERLGRFPEAAAAYRRAAALDPDSGWGAEARSNLRRLPG